MWLVLRVLLHLFPLVPLLQGRINFGIAAVLAVGICYIKTFKLSQTLRDLEGVTPRDDAAIASVRRSREIWRRLTFLTSEQVDR